MHFASVKILLLPTLVLGLGYITSWEYHEKFYVKTAYPEHLPGDFTGGFGEQTCHTCHFDYPVNYKEGKLSVEGVPEKYSAGTTYQFQIAVERPDLGNAGFQLSARFPDGTQAGTFKKPSDRVEITRNDSTDIQYVQHSAIGTDNDGPGKIQWTIEWTAPKSQHQNKLLIHIAANAANGDASAFGDFILVDSLAIKSSE